MMTKKHFLAQMEKLQAIFDEQVPMERLALYYGVMAQDFTDEQFDAAVNRALRDCFKFPPVAAFYKKDPNAAEPPKVYAPMTKEEAEAIRRTLDQYGL